MTGTDPTAPLPTPDESGYGFGPPEAVTPAPPGPVAPYPPQYEAYQAAPVVAVPVAVPGYPLPKNGLGTAGLVCGILGLVFSVIPIIGFIPGWPLAILGVVFSGIGLARATKRMASNRGTAIGGLVCGIIAIAFLSSGGGLLW